MSYRVSHIAEIIQAKATIADDAVIEHLLLDSRRIYSPSTSLFFAIKGPRRDGHQFIPELYKKGARHFVVSESIDNKAFPEANILQVTDTIAALQSLAAYHRSKFSIPVIGITGSNGKTIVKEWLWQLLQEEYNIVRSPKSFNSQIGVPLSIWQMNEHHSLGIFEAGISQPGEMENLQRMILPTMGILTNIGEAHSEGFESPQAKAAEKMKLFAGSQSIIYGKDNGPEHFDLAVAYVEKYKKENTVFCHWSKDKPAWLRINAVIKEEASAVIRAEAENKAISIRIPFTDDASVENAITCWIVMLILRYDNDIIAQRMKSQQPVNMRLELKKGINHCTIINDSYSADLSSLEMALNFLNQQSGSEKKTVILSDFLQSAAKDENLYARIIERLKKYHINRLIGIGERISAACSRFITQPGSLVTELYPSTDDFLQHFRSTQFREETILVKGARVFGFEKIVQLLEQKVHQTLLEINLNAIAHNLKQYQRLLEPSTKVMAMVKAFAYGSGGAEIAGILQYHKADYLGVAYADEGVELRRAGISLPVMVMNPEESSFDVIVDHNLEPEIYSFELLHALDAFLKKEGIQQYPVHIEIETGMNRLGFSTEDMERLGDWLNNSASFKIQSVFSHLAASEEEAQDDFTEQQYRRFEKAADVLAKKTGADFLRHIANSAGILRHPRLQMDMVRLGIGMYGIDSADSGQLDLQTVATLKSTIAQLKYLRAGDSVSYNRRGVVNRDSVIATVRLGYADGYLRRLGNGTGRMFVKGRLAPVIGTVCMDMTMIDVTDIPGVSEGDDVIIFGKELPVQQVSAWAGTIPYEMMTGISQRVKRMYFEE